MGRGGWGHPVCIITPRTLRQGDPEYLYLERETAGKGLGGRGLPERKAKGKGNGLDPNPTWG